MTSKWTNCFSKRRSIFANLSAIGMSMKNSSLNQARPIWKLWSRRIWPSLLSCAKTLRDSWTRRSGSSSRRSCSKTSKFSRGSSSSANTPKRTPCEKSSLNRKKLSIQSIFKSAKKSSLFRSRLGLRNRCMSVKLWRRSSSTKKMSKSASALSKPSSKCQSHSAPYLMNFFVFYPAATMSFLCVLSVFSHRLKKKFANAIKEMEGRHGLSISQLDSKFEKTISNRPRYQAVSSVKQSMSEKVMYSSMRS